MLWPKNLQTQTNDRCLENINCHAEGKRLPCDAKTNISDKFPSLSVRPSDDCWFGLFLLPSQDRGEERVPLFQNRLFTVILSDKVVALLTGFPSGFFVSQQTQKRFFPLLVGSAIHRQPAFAHCSGICGRRGNHRWHSQSPKQQ